MSKLDCLCTEASWWMIQWNLKASPPLSRTLSKTMRAIPLRSPVIAGAPSVATPHSLSQPSPIASIASDVALKDIDTRGYACKTLKIKQLLCDAEIVINTFKKLEAVRCPRHLCFYHTQFNRNQMILTFWTLFYLYCQLNTQRFAA